MRLVWLLLFCCCLPFQSFARGQELNVALEDWPPSYNPALQSGTIVFSIGAQLFAGLTVLDGNGKAVPYLAKRWELSEDKKTYTFYLHENAVFHNNLKITADDVIFSINFSRKNHPFYPFLENIEEVRKIDAYCLEIRLKYPMDIFPSFLLPIFVPILPSHYYSFTSFKYPVVGSGPYRIDKIEDNSAIYLKRFDKFFLSEKPKLERLTFKVYFDFYEIFYALKNDDVDMFMFYSCKGISAYLDKITMERFSVLPVDLVYPYMVITYNMRKPLFKDKRVRRALSLALDKEKLASYFQNVLVKPVNGGIPATNDYYVPISGSCDAELANRLLDEAGYPRDSKGKRFSVTMDYLTYSYMSEIIHWIQKEWSDKLGIELLLRDRNFFANVSNDSLSADFDLFYDELLLYHDPLIGMYRLYTEKNIGRNKLWTNVGAYKNKKVDELFEKVIQEQTEQGKKALYAEIQHVLADDYASLWLISNVYYLIAKKNILGLEEMPYKIMSPMIDVTVEE